MVKIMTDKTWRISLYLFLQDTPLDRSILRTPDETEIEDLPNAESLPFPHLAVVVRNKANTPSWVENLSDHFDISGLENQASSFVLLFEAQNRVWAISHGNGFHLIPPERVEPRFGIRVVANSIDPLAIKSIDTRTADVVSRTIRAQVSQGSAIRELGVAFDRELIQHLAGAPLVDDHAGSWAKRLAGSDSLQLSVTWKLQDIAKHVAELLEKFDATTYKESFGFIDHFRPLRAGDPNIVILDDKLTALIADRETHRVSLAAPSVLDDEEFGHFVVSVGRKYERLDELWLPDIYTVLDEWGAAADEALSRVKIRTVDKEGGTKHAALSLRRYITAEVDHEESTFVLLTGYWYSISDDYVENINAEIRDLVKSSRRHSLPPWPRGMSEPEYNQLAAIRPQWKAIDGCMVHYGGPNQKNEFGDLWNTRSKSVVHVKKMTSSAVLSHLWAQGAVATELYYSDPNYRAEVHVQIPKLPTELSNITVVYAVGTPKTGSLQDELFFFSKVSLVQSLRELRRMRCNVELVKIQMA